MQHLRYPPLHRSTRQIRLLSLDEGANSKILCNLTTVDLSRYPSFVALSYVWGSSNGQCEIILDGHITLVRRNLYTALSSILAYRNSTLETYQTKGGQPTEDIHTACKTRQNNSGDLWKYFWIDALCIDQDSIAERNFQVRIMSEIYRSANFVLVWLGKDCETALRITSTADTSAKRSVFAQFTGSFQDSEFSQKIIPFLNAKYWRRMWIVQEFVLAQEIAFFSGHSLVPWGLVDRVFPELYAHRAQGRFAHVLTLVNERRQHKFREQEGIRPDVPELINRFGLMECFDLRDRAFALVGLFSKDPDQIDNAFAADYSLTPTQLLLRILKAASGEFLDRVALESLHDWLKLALDVDNQEDDVAKEQIEVVLMQRETKDESLNRIGSATLGESFLPVIRGARPDPVRKS